MKDSLGQRGENIFVVLMTEFHSWIKEPVFESRGDAKLIVNRSDVLVKLTDSEIDHIVSKVNSWYESLTARR